MSENIKSEIKENSVIVSEGLTPTNKNKQKKKYNKMSGRPFIVVFTKKIMDYPYDTDEDGNKYIVSTQRKVEQLEERVEFHDSIKDRWLSEATVIIDIFPKEVIKNNFQISDEEIIDHYINSYSQKVIQALEQHIKNEAAKNNGDVNKTISQMEELMGIKK